MNDAEMGRRRYRLSDVVAAVCVPSALLMYLHLTILQSRQMPQQQISSSSAAMYNYMDDDAGLSSGTVAQKLSLPNIPPSTIPTLPPLLERSLGPPLNLTSLGEQHLLLFTQILKSGSTTVRSLLGFLKNENKFKFFTEPPQKSLVIQIDNDKIREKVAHNITDIVVKSALVHSFAYIDFARYNVEQPILISVVRRPVDRAVSMFYKARTPYLVVERYQQFPDLALPSRKFLKKSMEFCLRSYGDPECRAVPGTRKMGHTIQFFCGHHKECLKYGSGEAMLMAQRNVERSYAVVGILEEWPMTLAVLERYIPAFFANATRKYYDKIAGRQLYMNSNFYKPKVEQWALDTLSKNMTIEERFYEFLKRRLQSQYQALYP